MSNVFSCFSVLASAVHAGVDVGLGNTHAHLNRLKENLHLLPATILTCMTCIVGADIFNIV